MMICIDVAYRDPHAAAAGVLFHDWRDAVPAREVVVRIDGVEPYVSGQFYRRELPCILAVLQKLDEQPAVVVIDGHVWLDDRGTKGLGAHLHDALDATVAVVGVAKSKFADANAVEVLRGGSKTPLFVSSVGMSVADAAHHVEQMHGPHRLPSLIQRADRLSKDALL